MKNPVRCPVRLVDKYIRLLPPVKPGKKPNFYLRSLKKFTPVQWFGEQVVGLNSLKKVMGEVAKSAKLEGFVSNNSLRRTGTTGLVRGGVERKLVKEYTGHTSDAVDQYQITSDEQRKQLSKIIAGKNTKQEHKVEEINVKVTDTKQAMTCECIKRTV